MNDGRVEFDSNTLEHVLRPQTIHDKSALFAGSHGGGPMGDHRDAAADREDKRPRPARPGHASSRPDRAGVRSINALMLWNFRG
ncbi:IS66 family transposase [Bradyrhizobium japonicum]|uniref:IS66 family transposase n=1 Tax=Bradyrhizobium japonicum TaxID=375 RepID=UPI0012FDBD12